MKTLLNYSMIIVLLFTTACGESTDGGSDYDSKFIAGDGDGDGGIDDNEFYQMMYTETDANRDEIIDEDEWLRGRERNFRDVPGTEDYAAFDTDNDRQLTREEWQAGFPRTGWFEIYDRDLNGEVSEDEWNSKEFTNWDRNNDGVIDQDEYKARLAQ